MSDLPRIGLIGVGYAVPPTVRTNDDPVFTWLIANPQSYQGLFAGYDQRRVLAPWESIVDYMVLAATRAMEDAHLTADRIDLLIGATSVSDFITPDALAQVHHRLGLPSTTWVLPIADEFTNFTSGLVLAHTLAQAGRIQNALIVCGGNWSRFVDYHRPESVSAADGAGAALIGTTRDPWRFAVVDWEVSVASQYYGAMTMQADADPIVRTGPYFHLPAAGQAAFVEFGEKVPPSVVAHVLGRNAISPSGIALISHQASRVLLDVWGQAIGPAQYLDTLLNFGNMTLASIPVTLAYRYVEITPNALVLLSIGCQLQTAAVLLRRGTL